MKPTASNEPAPLRTLGERIKAVRSSWAWSQEEMADALRVDQASISFWERDKIKPSGSAMVALAALFRTSVEALETGTSFVVPDPPSRQPTPRRAEREIPRSVSLPLGHEEPVQMVDLVNGTTRGKQLSEAMMDLAQAVKDGRKVWVVME
ncbi:MAG: transcriptional repressor DicA [Acidobacteria bacterium ADurb.Bin340]|nr:MAG: transcriptional repressor DicA [Acidobacteria bacterium ADurb.Bin340]